MVNSSKNLGRNKNSGPEKGLHDKLGIKFFVLGVVCLGIQPGKVLLSISCAEHQILGSVLGAITASQNNNQPKFYDH